MLHHLCGPCSRILSRDNSGYIDPAESNTDQDFEATPPGTPLLQPSQRSPNIPEAGESGDSPEGGMITEATPPGTPSLSGRNIASARGAGAETTKVKEMRERVQEMTTGDLDNEQSISIDENGRPKNGQDEFHTPAIVSTVSSGPSSPPALLEEEIAQMPGSASAAEAERQADFPHTHPNRLDDKHRQGDITISEPEDLSVEAVASDVGMVGGDDHFPPAAPLKMSAVATLGRASHIPPPSPASSVRAETGSNAGDTDYLTSTFDPSRPGASRMSSMSSMRSAYNNPSSSLLSTPHLHLHSSLPRSASGLDTSDALSDISTEANPPGTPRPSTEQGIPPTPPTPVGAVAGISADEDKGIMPPPPTLAETNSASPTATTSSIRAGPASTASANPIQANFGRPTSSFSTLASSTPASSTPSKPFVNPFSSFGNSTSSPFAASSTFGSKAAAMPNSSSNLSTATPFGPEGSFGSGSASPFAIASTTSTANKNAFDVSTPTGSLADNKANMDDQESQAGSEDNKENNKVFSLQSEVPMLTGEEDEYTQYAVPRAKLYVMDGSEWKERGVGQVKLNSKADFTGERISVRLGTCGFGFSLRSHVFMYMVFLSAVMRSEAVHRLILNISLFSGMSVTHALDKFVRFSAFEEGVLRHFTIRIQNPAQSKELYDQVTEMLDLLPKREGEQSRTRTHEE